MLGVPPWCACDGKRPDVEMPEKTLAYPFEICGGRFQSRVDSKRQSRMRYRDVRQTPPHFRRGTQGAAMKRQRELDQLQTELDAIRDQMQDSNQRLYEIQERIRGIQIRAEERATGNGTAPKS